MKKILALFVEPIKGEGAVSVPGLKEKCDMMILPFDSDLVSDFLLMGEEEEIIEKGGYVYTHLFCNIGGENIYVKAPDDIHIEDSSYKTAIGSTYILAKNMREGVEDESDPASNVFIMFPSEKNPRSKFAANMLSILFDINGITYTFRTPEGIQKYFTDYGFFKNILQTEDVANIILFIKAFYTVDFFHQEEPEGDGGDGESLMLFRLLETPKRLFNPPKPETLKNLFDSFVASRGGSGHIEEDDEDIIE